jgi:opacity protein-like surface antigen
MKTWLLVGVAAIMLAAPAGAADLEQPLAPAPIYKAPLEPVPYYWSGLYIGGVGTYTFSDTHTTVTNIGTGTTFPSSDNTWSAPHGGGQIGFDYMFPSRWLVGVVADVFSGDDHTNSTVSPFGSSTTEVRTFLNGTARVRIGYAFDRVLLYGTGGYAWTDDEAVRTQVSGTVGNAGPGTVESASSGLSGWTAGAGVAYAFAQIWNVFAEYRYTTYASGFTFPISGISTNSLTKTNAVVVGLNVKLDFNPVGCPWYQSSC